MINCTSADVENLVSLQKNISGMLELKTYFVTAVKKMEELDAKRAKAQNLINTLETQISSLRKEYNENESQLKDIEACIAKSNQKLTAVKNDKEYKLIQKEINDLNQQSHELSDIGLKLLEKVETIEGQFNAREDDLRQFMAASARQRDELEKKALTAKKQWQKLDENVKKLRAVISEEMLAVLDDSIKHNLNHIGVAKVEDAVCQGCNVNVPRQIFNELQKNAGLDLCPTCRRLIYYEQVNN